MARTLTQSVSPLARLGKGVAKLAPVMNTVGNVANAGMTGMMMYNMLGGGGGGQQQMQQPQMAYPQQYMMPHSMGGYAMSVLSKQGSDPVKTLERLNKIAALPIAGMAGMAGRGLSKALPIVGNVLSAGSGIANAMKGNWGEAGLDFAGMLPGVGNAINAGRTAYEVGSALAPSAAPGAARAAAPRAPMTGPRLMGTGGPFGTPRTSVLNKFSSAELKSRALAFEVGMDEFCKEADFDAEDRTALIELIIKAAADPMPNLGSGVQRNPQGQVTGDGGGWWSNLASGFFDRFSKGMQQWGGQSADPLHASGEAAKVGKPPNAKFDAAVQAHDSTNIAGEKTKAFEAARQRMKDFSMTPQEAARDVFRQMGVHGSGWSREFLGQNSGAPAKAPGSPIFSKPPTTQPLAPKPIASPTASAPPAPTSTPGGGASPFAPPPAAAAPKMMASMDMPDKNFNVPGSGMPPPAMPASGAPTPAAGAPAAKPHNPNAGIYVPKSMSNEYGMQTGERGKVDLSSLGKPGFDQ